MSVEKIEMLKSDRFISGNLLYNEQKLQGSGKRLTLQ